MRTLALPAIVTFALLAGCADRAVDPDPGKTPAQLREEVKAADKPLLESKVREYDDAIERFDERLVEVEQEIEELLARSRKDIGEILGGEVPEGLKGQLDELKTELQQLGRELVELKEKAEVYVQELQRRA